MRPLTTVFFSSMLLFYSFATAQNIGIEGPTNRARVEVQGAAGSGVTSGIMGSFGTGVSFQFNYPTIGFNQYRSSTAGFGQRLAAGHSAVQYFDPMSGTWVLDMFYASGSANSELNNPIRALTVFPHGGVGVGHNNYNANFSVDTYDPNMPNTQFSGAVFMGTQHHTQFHVPIDKGYVITPGKDGSITYINDIPNGNIVMGAANCKIAINGNPLDNGLLVANTSTGRGLAIVNETNGNTWDWHTSNDPVIWLGLRYNGFVLGGYDPASGAYSYVSDWRLKTNIQSMPAVMPGLMKLRPVSYTLKASTTGHRRYTGFIAQEVEKLFPELVFQVGQNNAKPNSIDSLRMINYSGFFVLAIKALQEQQAEMDRLRKELKVLEGTHRN